MGNNYSHQRGFQLYRRLINYVFKYWPAFLIAMVGNVGYLGIGAYTTYLFKPVLNEGFIAHNVKISQFLPTLVLGIFFALGLMNTISSNFMARVASPMA
jgi:subfamily B ATP-binding cassette protein MsbA